MDCAALETNAGVRVRVRLAVWVDWGTTMRKEAVVVAGPFEAAEVGAGVEASGAEPRRHRIRKARRVWLRAERAG